ncbi:MAG: TIGR01777 family oxidoreductase [Balneolaceae bacterium]|nr:TIGR01777 family oxidoreductase [Balneolaceae bacterium]
MDTKKIIITGGTGFIGSYLCTELLKQGHFISIITRSPEKYSEEQSKNLRYIGWDDNLSKSMAETDVVINLVGESLFGKRWTESVKKSIYNSRIESTKKLVEAMEKSDSQPDLFISASAVGIYGDSGDKLLDESSPTGNDFLANVCKDWEKESKKAEKLGVRVVNPRLGIVMEKNGGFLQIMKLPFLFFVGGPIGDGNQYFPWIHMDDLVRALIYPIEKKDLTGPYNVCSPQPEPMNRMADALGNVLNRPSFFRVPEFVMKTILGEAAQPALASLNVQPKVLQISGFEFKFEDVEEALADIF